MGRVVFPRVPLVSVRLTDGDGDKGVMDYDGYLSDIVVVVQDVQITTEGVTLVLDVREGTNEVPCDTCGTDVQYLTPSSGWSQWFLRCSPSYGQL